MKRFHIVLAAVLMTAVLVGAAALVAWNWNPGNTDSAYIDVGESERFAPQEIEDAMAVMMKRFRGLQGCTLTDLWYDEVASDWHIEHVCEGRERGNIIVLFSQFDVDSTGGDGSFSPNSTYHWRWTLERNSKDSSWYVSNYGEG